MRFVAIAIIISLESTVVVTTGIRGGQKGLRAARPTARLMTCPDLLRLTRRILQVAELLPWPIKDRLFQVRLRLSAQGTCGHQVFWRGQS